MTEKRSPIRVQIAGEEYAIRSGETAEHTRAVAEYLDHQIKKILHGGAVVETHKAAILAALQITDELFRARADAERMTQSMQELSAEVKRWLPPVKRTDAV